MSKSEIQDAMTDPARLSAAIEVMQRRVRELRPAGPPPALDHLEGALACLCDIMDELELADEALRERDLHLRRVTRALGAERERSLELVEQSRRKDAFLALLGHELRNPLAAIEASLGLLAAPLLGVEAAKAPVRIIRSQLRHTIRIVDDLLDCSRSVQGKLLLRKGRVSLESLVAQSVAALRARIDGRNQWLSLSLPDVEVALEVDEARLVQVLSNLLDNASKYTPDHGNLGILASVEDGLCTVRVWDEGIGIPPDVLSHVLEMFVQGDRVQSRAPGGLGIGLPLARRLIELHGGNLEIRSPIPGRNVGTEVRIELPCTLATVDVKSGPHPAVDVRSHRILIVEDNVELATMLCQLLELQGHEVREASDSTQAFSVVETFSPELVLVDIGLPGIDGYEVAQRLRERLGTGVKLIATSGYPPDEDRLGSVFDNYLLKPIYPHQLASLFG